jgi:hypothetical protein
MVNGSSGSCSYKGNLSTSLGLNPFKDVGSWTEVTAPTAFSGVGDVAISLVSAEGVYKNIKVVLTDLVMSASNTVLRSRVSSNAGVTAITAANYSGRILSNSLTSSGLFATAGGSTSYLQLNSVPFPETSTAEISMSEIFLDLEKFNSTGEPAQYYMHSHVENTNRAQISGTATVITTSNVWHWQAAGNTLYTVDADYNGLNISPLSGTFSGTYAVYGAN